MPGSEGVENNVSGPTSPVPVVVMPEDKEVDEKTYHVRFPGSRFIMPDGAEVNFNGAGNLSTTSLNIQRELDKVSDRGGSPIYTKAKPVIMPSDTKPATDIRARAEEVLEQLRKAQSAATGG
jgi:hypothetical protein